MPSNRIYAGATPPASWLQHELQVLPPPIPDTVIINKATGLAEVHGEEDANFIIDWKGDRLKINPGDKLPFNFS